MKQHQKVHKEECDDQLRKKALNEVQPVESINKNPQNFQRTTRMQRDYSSHKLQGHVYK